MYYFKNCLIALISTFLLISCSEDLQQPTFQFISSDTAEVGSRYPNLYVDNTGMVTMSWILRIDEELFALQYANYDDGQWTEPTTIHVGTDFFVNWADFPSAVSRDGELVAAHRLKKIDGGTYAYNVNVLFPEEESRRWTEPITPHNDETATEHGFVSMEPLSDDKVLAIWLDGRHTEHRAHDEYGDPSQSMTLRSAEVSSDGTMSRSVEIDDMVCDCCQTDLIRTDDGAIAVYRGRTEDEIRDIRFSRYDLETGSWSEPTVIYNDNWQIGACPVNGPRIETNGEVVAVSWFTQADDKSSVKVSISEDGGVTFGEPTVISNERVVGRTDVLVRDNGDVYVSWMESRNGVGDIMLQRIGEESSAMPLRIGITSSSRRSGMPRMAKTDDAILFSWTQTEPNMRIRTALFPFDTDLEAIVNR
ncbi:MAG: sialidase family protein [Balneolaceae bacterium]